jgi:acetylornithine/succinyldiaminopimelate/putrescine aminotransferase
MNTVNTRPNLLIDRAKGSYLYSKCGAKILDWFADVGTVNLGYSPDKLMKNLGKSPQHIPNTLMTEQKMMTSERLCEKTGMDKVFFCNSGAEANEAAIKIVRKWNHNRYTRRKTIYTVKNGFHGRTYGAVSAGDGNLHHYDGFGPHLSGFKHFSDLDEINWDDAQAIMLATMFGNNDAGVYSEEFMSEINKKCKFHNVPLVLDEVQVGAGRTGLFNAFDWYGIEPDVLCLGKGIGCGVPTGVTLAKGEFADVFTPGSHYSTFGGSPLSCEGINFLMDSWENENLSTNVTIQSNKIQSALFDIDGISNVRGIGLWIAFDVDDNKAFQLSDELLLNGMFVPTFRPNAIKITPMLNSTDSEIQKGLEIIKKSVNTVIGK